MFITTHQISEFTSQPVFELVSEEGKNRWRLSLGDWNKCWSVNLIVYCVGRCSIAFVTPKVLNGSRYWKT